MSEDKPKEEESPGSPPGHEYVNRRWIVMIGAALLLITALLLLGLYLSWPSCEPSTTENLSQITEEKAGQQVQPQGSPTPVEVNLVSPNSGSVNGNTEVTIYGEGFKNGATVRFGGVRGTIISLSDESVTAKTPPRPEGEVDVIVTNTDGSSSKLNPGSEYTYTCPAPSGARLLLMVILAGALGGMLHSLRSFYWYVGNREFVWSWVPMYIVLPFAGATIAVIFYLIISGGFLNTVDKQDASIVIAVAALVGLFSQQAVLKLKDIADVVLTKPGEGKNSVPQSSEPVTSGGVPSPFPTPTITKIDPNEGPTSGGQEVAIAGTGFLDGAKVMFADKPAQVVKFISNTLIKVTTPAHSEGKVSVVVINPDDSRDTLTDGYTYKDGTVSNGNDGQTGQATEPV